MKRNKLYIWISSFVCIAILISGIWFLGIFEAEESKPVSEEAELTVAEKKKARSEYFFRMLRDPAKNKIPDNIRSRELAHAKQLPSRSGFLSKGQSGQAVDVTWQLAGPNELGGRTRALAVDQGNSDVILAGGVSGGVWKSTDGGNAWQMKTDPDQNMSVSSIAQDPTSTDMDTWYYASGEIIGNSASATGAFYEGKGIYKSTDNGDSWTLLTQASQFNLVSRIRVNPTTGTVFASSYENGIYRSTDGQSFSSTPVLTTNNYNDVAVASDGTIGAVTSNGVFISESDGTSESWVDVTPGTFPGTHRRSVLTFAPSNPDIMYVLTLKGEGDTSNQGVSFHKIDVSDPQNPDPDDRSENLPDFRINGQGSGYINLQFGYNMVVDVKPDNEDYVFVGGTNLFRSSDGFATTPSGGYDGNDSDQKDKYWIGGYNQDNSAALYPNQHPDQHIIIFPEPETNPNLMWAGHDGGLSMTTDVTATEVSWEDKDEGYVTGQFYTVAIPSNSDDNRIMGGTQDNGTPFFRTDGQGLTDISSGDGAYAFWGTDYAYVSTQLGNVVRLKIESDGSLTNPYDGSTYTDWSFIYPSNASNQLFIHPYEVDPNDEGIMYYPGDDNKMYRNTKVDELSSGIQGGTTEGWKDFPAVSNGYTITALDVTKSQPSDRLYYAAYGGYGVSPKIFYVDNASSSWSPKDISISDAPNGAYVHDIAVNPHDGDEIIAVMSNYNITGLYHSADGGESWTAIEGDLQGDSQNPGPSLRNVTILPTSAETVYLVGTSTGVYSTTTLDGSSTTWARESDDESAGSIGYSVSEHIVSRPVDGKIAVGTHGRGIFVGQTENVGGVEPPLVDVTLDVENNWQLVGSPMSSTSDVSLGDNLTMFGFSGTYESVEQMESQGGYWVKSRSGSQVEFGGDENTSATIALEEGWNLIGGITDTISVSSISDPNGILSSSPVYEYTGGSYQGASEIKSTQGYWIHANESGNIELSSGSSSSKSYLANTSNNLSKIEFQNGNASQLFYASSQSLDKAVRNQFRMPPKAPQLTLDVRTPEGFRLAEGKGTELRMTTAGYPVTVSTPENMRSNYTLKGITGKDTVYYNLKSDAEVSIQRPHEKLLLEKSTAGNQITEHNLLPNYPNPFNPTTNIRYQVASQTGVLVEVYDVLGRKVRTLVNEQQPRGSYSVQFDGRNLSSGTYFIHLKAGNTAKIQKMTLIK